MVAGAGNHLRLNRGLLVDTEHDGVLGRVPIEPDDISHLGREGRNPALNRTGNLGGRIN
jgi:hypothetical protein